MDSTKVNNVLNDGVAEISALGSCRIWKMKSNKSDRRCVEVCVGYSVSVSRELFGPNFGGC